MTLATDGAQVEVRRGPYVESVHCVTACVARADGEVLRAYGDIDAVYPIRSLAKPFIARELAGSRAAEEYELGDVELALASGSHEGESRHIEAIRLFLAKVGVEENALLCGPALQGNVLVGPPIANNCSGKHAAVLALCRLFSWTPDGYLNADHPVQRMLIPELTAALGCEPRTPLVVDGCGMPIFGASLHQIATAYARLSVAKDRASTRVRAAMRAQPGYVGGWNGNLDTRIITWSRGAILAKIGAEGLHADALVGEGIGIAMKVLDGNSRALAPILAQLFQQFGRDHPIASEHLAELASPPVLNAAGRRVGDLRWSTDAQPAAFEYAHYEPDL